MGKKRLLAGLVMLAVLALGCGKDSGKKSSVGEKGDQVKTVKLVNSKGEVADQMGALADAFNKSHPNINVEVETLPSGVDVQSTLKGYYLAGNVPDIISCEAAGFEKWAGLLVDLSDQEWVSDTDAAFKDETYGTLGFPYTTEAIGLIYNADILEKAGVNPAELTGPAAYRSAFETINNQKEALGLTAVVGYCAEKENLYWSSGNHIFGNYLDAGLSRDDTTYLDLLEKGQIDESRMTDYASFVGMLNAYSDPALLTTGTYDDQVANFASGKYAFVTQGSWIGSILSSSDSYSGFAVGMAPYSFQDGIDTILTNSPSWWAVMKEGNVEEAKVFLAWCAESEGQQILVEEAGFISPFKSCTFVAKDPFAETVSDYLANGKTSSWHWMNVKEGLAEHEIAPIFYDYAAGNIDASGFVNGFKNMAASAYSN